MIRHAERTQAEKPSLLAGKAKPAFRDGLLPTSPLDNDCKWFDCRERAALNLLKSSTERN